MYSTTLYMLGWRCFSPRFAVSLDLEVGNNPLRDVVPRKSFVNFGFRLLSLKLWLDSESILQQRCAPHSAVQCWSGSNCVVIPRIWKEFIIFVLIRKLTSTKNHSSKGKKGYSSAVFTKVQLVLSFSNYCDSLILRYSLLSH